MIHALGTYDTARGNNKQDSYNGKGLQQLHLLKLNLYIYIKNYRLESQPERKIGY